MNPAELEALTRRWRWRDIVRTSLFALGGGGLFAAAAIPGSFFIAGRIFAGMTAWVFLVGWLVRRRVRIGPGQLVEHLDRTFPELEESSGLWLRTPESLRVPETLQRRRIDAAWSNLGARGDAPGHEATAGYWQEPTAWFSVGMAALALGVLWRVTHPPRLESQADVSPGNNQHAPPRSEPLPTVKLTGVTLTVVPPLYTGRAAHTVAGLDAEVEEGATLTWQIQLSGPPAGKVRVTFDAPGNPELTLREQVPGAGWEGARTIEANSGLYHLAVVPLPGGPEIKLPEIGSLKVLPDAPPAVTILKPTDPRTELDPADAPQLPVEVRVTDDYGVSGARLVATVAKGSGEGVKFRERTLKFDPPGDSEVVGQRERRFNVNLDPASLGMEPGDELYFHVEAEDNHPPTAHRTRSETRFLVLRGPTSAPAQAGRGLAGVNLVPEYFRSERQIILDTEKLLGERDRLPEREFRRRSEDLGADQALLRLRYGQFVGEESETGAGGGGDHAEVNLNPLRANVPNGVPADLVHQHDQGGGIAVNDPRAGLRTAMRLRLEHADQARGGGGHDAAPAVPDAGLPPTAGQIVAPYVDQHDSQEAATLFDHETKASLRGVLAAMWSAEGFLRTARPAEALEPEHRALDLLKELQQGERVYVQRVGFEPTPLRVAERRGRGEIADVPERIAVAGNAAADDPAPARVREALAALPGGNGGARGLAPELREVVGRAGEALSEAAGRQGGTFLEGLRALRRLESGENLPGAGDVAAVRSALLRLLPPGEERPRRPVDVAPDLVRIGHGTVTKGATKP